MLPYSKGTVWTSESTKTNSLTNYLLICDAIEIGMPRLIYFLHLHIASLAADMMDKICFTSMDLHRNHRNVLRQGTNKTNTGKTNG